MDKSDENSKKTILLLGATGTGKSYLGNKILNKKVFIESKDKSAETLVPVAQNCVIGRDKLPLTVVDCPGFGDNRPGESEFTTLKRILSVFKKLKRSLTLILYCVKATDDRLDIVHLKKLGTYFGKEIFRNTLIVETQIDKFQKMIDRENFLKDFRKDTQEMLLGHTFLKKMADSDVLVWDENRKDELFFDPLIKSLKMTPNYEHPMIKIDIEDPKGVTEFMDIKEFQNLMKLSKDHLQELIEETQEELAQQTDDAEQREIEEKLKRLQDSKLELERLLSKKGATQLAILLRQNNIEDNLYNYFYSTEAEPCLYNDINDIIQTWYKNAKYCLRRDEFWHGAIKAVNDKIPAKLEERCKSMIDLGIKEFGEAYTSSLYVKAYEPSGILTQLGNIICNFLKNKLKKYMCQKNLEDLVLFLLMLIPVDEWISNEELPKVVEHIHQQLRNQKKLYKALAKGVDGVLKQALRECWSLIDKKD